jgi:iron complex transport system substrate-binding protein
LNKNWIRWLVVLALALFATAAVACNDDDDARPDAGDASPAAQAGFPLSVERSDGTTLELDAPPQRIVSLSPAATEIIYAIGAEASLVAVDNQADYPEAAANFPTKVDAFEPSVEAIAALNPDLVFVATDIDGIVARLDELNIPVLYSDIDTDVQSVDDVFEQVRLLGRVTGRSEQAEAVVADMETRIAAIEEKLQEIEGNGPSVYHELDSTFYSVAEQSFIGDVYALLRADNIAGDGGGSPYPQLSQEAIIAADPDVIILADEEFGVTVDSVKARPGWDVITAVRDDRIHGIDPDIISRPGPRIVDAIEQIAQYLYPETFA